VDFVLAGGEGVEDRLERHAFTTFGLRFGSRQVGMAAPVSRQVMTWVMAQYTRGAAEVGRCS
jgi:hypothetical protein